MLAGGRFTTAAESNYKPIEGGALGVAYGLWKTRHFTLGCEKLLVAVDHKPLVKVLSDKNLHELDNSRLKNLKEKMLAWKFRMLYVPGTEHEAPDALSRYREPTDTTDRHGKVELIVGMASACTDKSTAGETDAGVVA